MLTRSLQQLCEDAAEIALPMQATRRAGILILASILAALTIAPHHHDLLGDDFSGRGSIVEHIGACHESRTHLHAARAVDQHPCFACAAQHRASLLLPMSSTPALQNACAAVSSLVIGLPRAATIALALLRAPPL
jgi:hypothetical protein